MHPGFQAFLQNRIPATKLLWTITQFLETEEPEHAALRQAIKAHYGENAVAMLEEIVEILTPLPARWVTRSERPCVECTLDSMPADADEAAYHAREVSEVHRISYQEALAWVNNPDRQPLLTFDDRFLTHLGILLIRSPAILAQEKTKAITAVLLQHHYSPIAVSRALEEFEAAHQASLADLYMVKEQAKYRQALQEKGGEVLIVTILCKDPTNYEVPEEYYTGQVAQQMKDKGIKDMCVDLETPAKSARLSLHE